PLHSPTAILAAYRKGAPWSDAALKGFVQQNFTLPGMAATPPAPTASPAEASPTSLAKHIADLWPVLTRHPSAPAPYSSALYLPKPYVVPGGRFREIYYWDSYFTMLGLAADGRQDLVESMIDDFGHLIERYGHIPNGSRTYYLGRSQPPFFYAMVGLSKAQAPAIRAKRLAWMRAEHDWWMASAKGLKPGQARDHVVAMPDGTVLNRYYDARDTPRDESYRMDVTLARAAHRDPAGLYRDLRAAGETGWDFSSRWLADGKTLATIHTTDFVPVDLNSLLYGMERAIEAGCRASGDLACAGRYAAQAEARAQAVRTYLWDAKAGTYLDYDWRAGALSPHPSAAMLYPLFTGLASEAQAHGVAAFTRANLLASGGLRTTLVQTGQQWDIPNGWPPLQWVAVQGLRRYGETGLADEVTCRWMTTVRREYKASGRLVEKYDVEALRPGGGGEYPLQDGFGWTNGVTRALMGSVSMCKAAA
ncbi:MAG: alpha,alpha-trehalase TreF, partial [Caulobacteraceae bacterium]